MIIVAVKKRIAIIGAGISGLSLAWLLKQKYGESKEIHLFESSSRAGGWVKTIDSKGFLFELGPRSCRPKGNGRYTLKLIEALGLCDQVIPASLDARQRYLYLDGKLQPMPNNFRSFMRSPLMKGVIPALFKELWKGRSIWDDESVYSFASRRFGPEIAERFFDPMVSGIYAGEMRELSIKSCFPFLHAMEKRYRSLLIGSLLQKRRKTSDTPFVEAMQKTSLFSFEKGMGALVEALAGQLRQQIRYNCPVESICLDREEEGFRIKLETQELCRFDKVYACLPAWKMAPIVKEWAPSLSESLAQMETTSLAIVSLGYKKPLLPFHGFGCLIPHCEGEEILGIVWDSSVFPQQNRTVEETRLTVMIGGKRRQELLERGEAALLKIALNAVKKQLGIQADPDAFHVEYARNAVPQYTVGHSALVSTIEKQASALSENFQLLGSSYRGVSINDCIAEAYAVRNF